jgi:chaperonin cofactor prefoldin
MFKPASADKRMSDDPTGRIIELLIDLQTGQSAIMERLDRHEQRMDRLEERLDRLEERLDRHEQRMDRLDERLDRLRTDLMARMDRLQDALTLH